MDEIWIFLFSWEISVGELSCVIDRALNMNSHHWFPIQSTKYTSFFHLTIVLVINSQGQRTSACITSGVKTVVKEGEKYRVLTSWAELSHAAKLLCAVPVTVSVQAVLGPNSEMPNSGIGRNRWENARMVWIVGLDRRIVKNLHDFCGAGGRTLSAWMQGLSGKAS